MAVAHTLKRLTKRTMRLVIIEYGWFGGSVVAILKIYRDDYINREI